MAHWKSLTDTQWLYAHDLGGKDVSLQIDRVEGGEIVGVGGLKTKKPKCFFKGPDKQGKPIKPLVLNATNCKTISKLVGDPDVKAWAGQWITLYATECSSAAGEVVPCIRVRPKQPNPPTTISPEPKTDKAAE